MPPEQAIRIIRGQDLVLRFKMAPPKSISGWAMQWEVKTKLGGSSAISKTVGSGITITNSGIGEAEIALAKANTSALTLTKNLATGEGYVWELRRIDSGSVLVLARGELILEEEVVV